MALLGIETSCDETSAAVVSDGKVLSNVVSSQVDLHAVYGGVVPEIASREHLKLIDAVILQALEKSSVNPSSLDAVAVTRGPGLPSALLVGVATARGLALRLGKPLVPIHHMEAHLYSAEKDVFPSIALVVSGGHTLLIHVQNFGNHKLLGQTRDDAAGEAFDKAAQLIELGYPGGPKIEKQAREGNPKAYDFPRPMIDSGDWSFSFSGLKTAVRRQVTALREQNPQGLTPQHVADLCASFQAAVIDVLVSKTMSAAGKFQAQHVSLSGGVCCNNALRTAIQKECDRRKIDLTLAEKSLCTDNAAMIALLAERKLAAGFKPPEDNWDIEPDWILSPTVPIANH